jgi:hypothetical protein
MSTNEITGDKQQTKPATDLYRENYDKIFGKKKCQPTLNTNPAQTVEAETILPSTPITSIASAVDTCCSTHTTTDESKMSRSQIKKLCLCQKT